MKPTKTFLEKIQIENEINQKAINLYKFVEPYKSKLKKNSKLFDILQHLTNLLSENTLKSSESIIKLIETPFDYNYSEFITNTSKGYQCISNKRENKLLIEHLKTELKHNTAKKILDKYRFKVQEIESLTKKNKSSNKLKDIWNYDYLEIINTIMFFWFISIPIGIFLISPFIWSDILQNNSDGRIILNINYTLWAIIIIYFIYAIYTTMQNKKYHKEMRKLNSEKYKLIDEIKKIVD